MAGTDATQGTCGAGPKERAAREWKEEDATCASNGDADLDADGDPEGEGAAFHSAWGNAAAPPAPLWHSGPSAVGAAPSPQQNSLLQVGPLLGRAITLSEIVFSRSCVSFKPIVHYGVPRLG